MSSYADTLSTVFCQPGSHAALDLIKRLKTIHHPSSHHITILTNQVHAFPLSGYLSSINVSVNIIDRDTYNVTDYDYSKETPYQRALAGSSTFKYEGTEFHVYKASWTEGMMSFVFYDLVFDGADDSVGQKLATQVYDWAHSLKEEIWVFEGGCWTKSKQLYKSVHGSNWDDIVLDDKFKLGLQRDTETFFASKDVYASLGITWKRGILLLGPPGNGKTESIKALLKDATCAVLYAKSFSTRNGPEDGVRAIFSHARERSPCILVIEDLDAMVTDDVRSFFLNELDGLAQNNGILTIATTNHPERIDDAILNRPSRFDVKYTFELPDSTLRKTFALKWMNRITAMDHGIRFENTDETATAVSEKTEGWSFAFLKELFVSFLLRIAHDKSKRARGDDVPAEASEVLLLQQIEQLAAQIVKSKDDVSQAEGKARMAHPSFFQGARMMRATAMAQPAFHGGVNF